MSPSTASSLSPDHHGDKYLVGNGLSHHHHHLKKKRVGKACDSCRLKKTKCSGKQPCEKCQADNKICVYTERKRSKDKVYSYEYVELIEQRFFMVKKSLIRLCELIKSGNESSVQLADFANRLNYDPDYEEGGSPISINQAVSLLLDRADSIDVADEDTDINFNTTDEIPVNTSSNLAKFDTLSASSKPADFHNGSKTNNANKKASVFRVREKQPTLSTDYHVVLSSPESLTSKSDEQLSPLQNAATNESSIDSFVTSERQPTAISSTSTTRDIPSLPMSKSSTLTGIKEENDTDDLLSPTSPLLSGVSSNKPDQFDLGPFQSGAQLAAAIMNGFYPGDRLQLQKQHQNTFSNSSSNSGFFSMSDFDLNNNSSNSGTGTGSGTPASMMGSSPATESLKLHYTGSPTLQPNSIKSSSLTTINSGNNESFSSASLFNDKLIQPGDSFIDFFNAVEPPSNLNHHQHNNHHNSQNISRSDSTENKKHTHHGSVHHGSGHARSYSPHPHPYRTSSISSSSAIGVVQQYPTAATTVGGGGGDSMASNVVFENDDKDDLGFLFKSY